MMRTLVILLATLCTCTAVADKQEIDLTAESLNRSDRIQFGQYLGRDSAFLSGGVYAAKDTQMYNGQIDVDVAMHGQRGFIGIVFRHQSDTDYELVYLRQHKSGLPDALQYTPVLNGMSAWQLYSNEGFIAPANLAHNRWVHIRIVIQDNQASVYVDDREEPALVSELQGDFGPGAVGLWGRNVAHFSNFSYTPAAESAPRVSRKIDIPANAITDWQISTVYEQSRQSETQLPDRVTWQNADVESGGLLNISRYLAKLDNAARQDQDSTKDLVFARTTITSNRDGYRKLRFGYSDDVTIILNGQPLYMGRSGFSERYPGSLGILGLEDDALYLPLKRGDNELVFAISEVFGGWGLAAILEE